VSLRLLRCIKFSGRMSEMGQFLPPSLATAMEELASTPDAKARNGYAAEANWQLWSRKGSLRPRAKFLPSAQSNSPLTKECANVGAVPPH